MQEFVESLKETYTERQLSCEEQWPPVSVEKLVQLQLVETDKKEGFRAGLPQHGATDDNVKCTPILHGDLFKVEEGKKPVRKYVLCLLRSGLKERSSHNLTVFSCFLSEIS